MKPVILALILLAEVAGATDPLCGDCDANSDVALPDVLAAAQEALGGYAGPLDRRGCDVDSDGAIDVLDALLLAQPLVGLPVTLTCAPR